MNKITYIGIKAFICGLLIVNAISSESQTLRRVPEEYQTIQQAIQASANGDTVLVNDGFYPEQVNFLGKNIVLASHYILDQDSSHIYNTEINRSYLDEGVKIIGGEGPSAQLLGFMISNCLWKAVYCKDSSPTIRHNIIKGNAAYGLYLRNSAALISDNEIHGCPGFELGGPYDAIISYNSGPLIERNLIIEDEDFNVHAIQLDLSNTGFPGISIIIRENMIIGGIFGDFPNNGLPHLVHHNIFIPGRESSSAMNVTHCGEGFKIYNNTVVGGFGIWIQHGEHADIRNNLVAYAESGIHSSSDTVTIAYNNEWECGDKYRGIGDQTVEDGNISADPALVDPENGDFHENCWSANIDAGDPTMDFSQEPSPNGSRINIGRYGNTAEAAKSVPCIRVLPELIDFGYVEESGQKDSIVFLYNRGHDLLLVSALNNSDTANFSHSYGSGTTIMPPGDSLRVTASFHPKLLAASYYDSITITSNSATPGIIYMIGETNVGIEPIIEAQRIALFPVPLTGDFLTLKKSSSWTSSLRVDIINAAGIEVYSEMIYAAGGNEIRMNTGRLKNGIYCLRLTEGNQVTIMKFIRLSKY
jgi:hypothetical protein